MRGFHKLVRVQMQHPFWGWIPTQEAIIKCLGLVVDEHFSSLVLHQEFHEELASLGSPYVISSGFYKYFILHPTFLFVIEFLHNFVN
ncbi:hypothetical protein LIER_27758 [Lithospermum erythrorhizon]|uniref:Uncharacterized protein n=1 Tax=Lithospermum erythrorhizon TaxID=34254 RepID=A0AAV3RDA0_LITER